MQGRSRALQNAYYYSSFLVAVAEEQDSSPLSPSRNRGEAAGSHTNDPDTDWFEELPTHPVIEEQATITDPIDAVMCDEPKRDDPDLLFRIRGFYRLLDLISEQGSGGAGMIKARCLETQLTVTLKWTRSSSLKCRWRSL